MLKRKTRVGVIGHTGRGDYGHGLDRCWLEMPEAEIVAVADAHEQGRAAAAKRLQVDNVFADYRQMMDQTHPDVVSICMRHPDQHADIFLSACERGIHCYMEKPMCRDLVEADQMVAAAEKNSIKLALAHTTRFSPILDVVMGLIRDGEIGTVLELRGRGKEDARRGGGEDLWVLGSHVLNLVHAISGEPRWCFASVTEGGEPVSEQHIGPGNESLGLLAGDTVHATYGFDDGVQASFDSVRAAGAPGRSSRFGLQIFGSTGIIEILTGYLPSAWILKDPSWSPGRSGAQWVPISSAGVGKAEPIQGNQSLLGNIAACRDLLQSIRDDRLPECDIYQGRQTVEMIAAAFESQRMQQPVTFPLEIRQNPLELIKNGN